MADYDRACAEFPKLSKLSPEAICVDHVVMRAIQSIPNDPASVIEKVGSVQLVFDQNEPFERELYPRATMKWSKRKDIYKCIAGVGHADMRTVAALQAADYLAWLTNRYRAKQDRTAQFRRLLSSPTHESFYGYDELLSNYRDVGWLDE